MKRIILYGLVLLFVLNGCMCFPEKQTPTNPPAVSSTQPADVGTTSPPTPDTEPAILETEPVATETEPVPPESDADFVKVRDFIPDIEIDLRYATENNFTGQVIYDFNEPYLRYGTVKKLMQVQEQLALDGYRLKIWDGFRPTSAQFKLWEVCPDATYVANPHNGFSPHSRGNTVDLTMVYSDGTEVVMPTGFDDFSTLANRDYSDCSEEAANNARYLEEIMEGCGFQGYYGEWWHYVDGTTYPVEKDFDPGVNH